MDFTSNVEGGEKSSSEEDSDTDNSFDYPDTADDDFEVNPKLFEPIYDNASITQCGAYVAIMEFKRSCRLPFSCIEKLLQLLQLLCPTNNSLPRSVYTLRKFFNRFSVPQAKRKFCSDCTGEISDDQQDKCSNRTCRSLQPSSLTIFNPIKAIERVLKSKYSMLIRLPFVTFGLILLCRKLGCLDQHMWTARYYIQY